jgi:uncharacterized protein YraI
MSLTMPLMRAPFAAVTVIALTAAASAKPVTLPAETNLRAAPGTKSEIVTLMPKGSAIEVGECDAGWCKVTFGDKEGFAIGRNLGEAPPQREATVRKPSEGDLQRLRRGYEQYFDDEQDGYQDGYEDDRTAGIPPQHRYSQRNAPRDEDDYYDDDDAPVVYGRPAYVPGPPVYRSYYYPFPRVYYGPPRYYYRRW